MSTFPTGNLPPIRDLWARVLLSPVLGALVGRGAGLIGPRVDSDWPPAAHFAAFAVVAFVVWEGNRRLYFRARGYGSPLERPWRRLALIAVLLVFFTVPATSGLLLLWRSLSSTMVGDASVALAVLMAVTGVAIITHAYETVFLRRAWERERLRVIDAERARARAELDALQRETDPHYLFNSLNTLHHLIDIDASKATAFVQGLAAGYRYILRTRDQPLVSLADELESLRRFHALIDIRYEGTVRLACDISVEEAVAWELPPLSLQELLENAVKHTRFGPDQPLVVWVSRDADELVVANRLARVAPSLSGQLGLANLNRRVTLATGRSASWGAVDGELFVVRVPLRRRAG